ncbi:MAG: putative DNA base hypermodification protein [Alphaproteobacteria bacterium]
MPDGTFHRYTGGQLALKETPVPRKRNINRQPSAPPPPASGDLFDLPSQIVRPKSAPDFFVKAGAPHPTDVFNSYWRFACKRQDLFFNKLRRPNSPPWTDDPALRRYKFTNAYRASDRVSQYLIRNIIYADDPVLQQPEEIFFRTILFKLFNKIATWELLEREVGSVRWIDYSFDRYNTILTRAMEAGTRIYSAAYIMASGQSAFGHARKHANHLCLLEKMMADRLADRFFQTKPGLDEVYEAILGYPAIGPFLAYQYAVDLNYGPLLDASEDEFVMPGPGAHDGIAKCFSDLGDFTPQDVIHWTRDRQHEEFARLGLDFATLWGRDLTLIDCQNLYCETDKYARVVHPEIRGRSDRTRIKQMYRVTPGPIHYWYPPKWGINDKVEAWVAAKA